MKIIQDTKGIFEQGFYFVIDTEKDIILKSFQFKKEAINYIKSLTKN
jgi:hypothetical protein